MRSHRGRPTINKHIQERRVMIESVCWLLSLTIVAGVFVFAAISSRAGGGVLASPQLSITNCLADSFEAKLSTRKYPTEQQILLTNCVAWSGYGTTTNDSRQNLSNLTVTVVAGSATTNRTFTGTLADSTNGTWWASVTFPAGNTKPKIEVTLTDTNSKSRTYPRGYVEAYDVW